MLFILINIICDSVNSSNLDPKSNFMKRKIDEPSNDAQGTNEQISITNNIHENFSSFEFNHTNNNCPIRGHHDYIDTTDFDPAKKKLKHILYTKNSNEDNAIQKSNNNLSYISEMNSDFNSSEKSAEDDYEKNTYIQKKTIENVSKDESLVVQDKITNENHEKLLDSVSRRTLYRRTLFYLHDFLFSNNVELVNNILPFFENSSNSIQHEDPNPNFLIYKFFSNLDFSNLIRNIENNFISLNLTNVRRIKFKNVINFAKFHSCCPFCRKSEIWYNESVNIKEIVVNKLARSSSSQALIKLIMEYIVELDKFVLPDATLLSFFNSLGFFKLQRHKFEEMLDLLNEDSMQFTKQIKMQLLHVLYHRLMSDNFNTKIDLLPEFPSFIYIILRSQMQEIFVSNNRYFVILFFSLYSINFFFSRIDNQYQIIKSNEVLLPGYLRIVLQSISYLIRISFIELALSSLSVDKKAGMRYHFMCLTIFQNELLQFRHLDHRQSNLAKNFARLINLVLICEDNIEFEIFSSSLENNITCFLGINRNNIRTFLLFLEKLEKMNH